MLRRGWSPIKLSILGVLFVCLLPRQAGAQTASKLLPSVNFDTVKEGMPRAAVTSIVQDNDGFLWFGTHEGLGRYDGYAFRNYDSSTTGGIPLDFTVTALAASEGAIWIGTDEDGLLRLDLESDEISSVEALSTVSISALAASGTELWVGSAEEGAFLYDAKSKTVTKTFTDDPATEPYLSANDISAVMVDSEGRVWIGTTAGLNILNKERSEVQVIEADGDNEDLQLPDDIVTSLLQTTDKTVWVGTQAGLVALDSKVTKSKPFFDGDDQVEARWISTILEGQDGGLWLGTRGVGVIRLDPKTEKSTIYAPDPNNPDSVLNTNVTPGLVDSTGVLWFGFNAGGASKLYLLRKNFGMYRSSPGLSFYESGDHLWIGSQGAMLRRLHIPTGEVKEYLEPLRLTWTMSLAPATGGRLWIGTTDDGIYQLDPTQNQAIHFSGEKIPSSAGSLLAEGGNLWVGTLGEGLHFYNGDTGQFQVYATSVEGNTEGLADNLITTLVRDPLDKSQIWIGTKSGLNLLETKSGKFSSFLHNPEDANSLCHPHVTDVLAREKDVWVSTWGGGVCKFDRASKTFTAYGIDAGLSSDVIYRLEEDNGGNIWMSSNNGLSRFVPNREQAVSFGAADGLTDNVFAQAASHAGKSGRLYFGGPMGFNAFNPEEIQRDTIAPKVAVSMVSIVGKKLLAPKSIDLTYQEPFFSVEFAAMSFADPERNRYRHRLRGYRDWTESTRNFLEYSSLPSGDYVLEIQGANSHGTWSDKTISMPVHMAPPPWLTWWAYLLYAMVIAAVVALWIARNKRRLNTLVTNHRLSELEKEMELTSAVQDGFLPNSPSVQDGDFRLEGFYQPATLCSGDWWWYEKRESGYFVVVADVTGHGAGPAMVTAAVAASFRSIANLTSDVERLREINAEVCRISDGRYNMTMTALDIDPRTGEYKLYFAGGLPAFSAVPGQPVKSLISSGTPLGTKNLHIGMLDGVLKDGERLMLLTDGIPEIEMHSKKLFGMRRLSRLYSDTLEAHPAQAIQQIVTKVTETQGGLQDDDWTMVLIEKAS